MPRLRPDFLGIHAGRSPSLFRISRVPYLMNTLERGQLRFAPAKGYKALDADAARGDVHLAPVTYYDVYHPPGGDISPVTMKEMRFAYQRELRLVLDPGRDRRLPTAPSVLTSARLRKSPQSTARKADGSPATARIPSSPELGAARWRKHLSAKGYKRHPGVSPDES